MSGTLIDRLSALSPAKRALLNKRLAGSSGEHDRHIPVAPRDDAIPAAFSQERMWLFQQMYPQAIPYNSQVAIHFTGPLDVDVLARSLSEIVRRHEIYRTSLAESDGGLIQRIHPPQPAHLAQSDLSHLPEGEREPAARRIIEDEVSRPFLLDRLPLVRWRLIRLAAVHHILVCMDHHAVTDGWSRNVVFQELMQLYSGSVATGRLPELAAPRLQFADFAVWQRRWLASEEGQAQIGYWRAKLAGCPASLDLPYDRLHPARPSFRGGHEMMLLGEEELKLLRQLATATQATMFMAVLTVFLVLLHRYSEADEICVGTGIANRRIPDTDGLIGMLINTVVLRAQLGGKPSFVELLGQVRALTLEAYENQEAPFEKVVEAVAPARHAGINPLHQVAFNFQNNPMPEMSFPGLQATLERPLFNGSAKFDLYVAGWPRSDDRRGAWQRDDRAVLLSWEFNADVFDVATVRQMQAHFRSLLVDAGRHPEHAIADLRMVDDNAELPAAVDAAGATSPEAAIAVHALFERQVRDNPQATALVFGDQSWSYGELDDRAQRLATHLIALTLGTDAIVGICMERCPEMIAALLGTLKAGAAYMPLDPSYPADRLARLTATCSPSVVITTGEFAARLSATGVRVLIAEQVFSAAAASPAVASTVSPECLAYVLFTSGSTGAPKAVAVPHRAVTRLVHGADFARMNAGQTWLQISPLAFDASTLEIWAPLCNGGRLVLMLPGISSLDDIGATIKHHGVTSAWLTAGLFQAMVNERVDDLAGLDQLLTGGDIVPVDAARKVMQRFPGLQLINGYGPTENTTFTCCHLIRPEDLQRRSLPIGKPIAGTSGHILDALGRRCPIGVPGELCTGGAGLARGYWNDPVATAERFFEHPEFGRLYRTGDRCRRLPDGAIEFLSRMDRQIKVRGYRVEPEEIETVLRNCRGVGDCTVVARGSTAADKHLVAYIVPVPDEMSPSAEDIRRFLRQQLPDYALPSVYAFLERFPLTPNGKIDYRALPESPTVHTGSDVSRTAPRTPTEVTVAGVWKEVLGRSDFGVEDDFFVCGGHSLAALKVLALIKERAGVTLKALDFFEHPTIAGFAARVDNRAVRVPQNMGSDQFVVRLRAGGSGAPVFMVPGGQGEPPDMLVFAALLGHLDVDRPMYGICSRAQDRRRLIPGSLEEQIRGVMQAIEAVSPEGPITVIGECAASTIAITVADRINARGRAVESLILLDPGSVAHLRSSAGRFADSPNGAPGALPPRVARRLAKYFKLLASWEPTPIRSPLHVVLSSRFADVDAVTKSWQPLAQGGLHVHRTHGDHHTYIRDHAAQTAAVLTGILNAPRG